MAIDVEYDTWHIVKATLLAGIATLLLIFQQTRHTFYETRKLFITYKQQRNKSDKAAAIVKKRAKKSYTARDVHVNEDDGTFIIGFFHPHCSAGGGGERVLWKAIQALGEMKEGKMMNKQQRRTKTSKKESTGISITDIDDDILANCKNISVVIYTIDVPTKNYDKEVLEKVRDRFSIIIPSSLSIHFVHLHEVKYLLGELVRYQLLDIISFYFIHSIDKCLYSYLMYISISDKPKRFTMIAESWGTMKLAWHALNAVPPHVYIDTTGCAFTFFVARVLAGCKVATYVHYPTISTDML